MQEFDLGIAWCWEYDREMVSELEQYIHQKGLTIYQIAPYNLEETIDKLKTDQLRFKLFFDRASDQDEEFERLNQLIKASGMKMINDYDKACWSSDKATMHLEFLSAGIEVPYTIILSPYEEEPELRTENLPLDILAEKIGTPFVLKPALGAGSEGVVLDAKSTDDIEKVREEFSDDKYLVQQKIEPIYISGKRGWFRVFYSCGKVFPCLWDDLTRLSEPLLSGQIDKHICGQIEELTKKIVQVCGLDLFSTEIAITQGNKLIVVDYVNDQCDLRKKSLHYDGIPDEVVQKVLLSLVNHIYFHSKAESKENLRRL
jgi:hypothetical protein